MMKQIQAAIYTLLTSSVALTAIVGSRIYDAVPQAADSGDASAFPYLVIGDDSSVSWAQDDAVGSDATITIHTWSRYAGRLEVKQIQGILFDILSRYELTVTGHNVLTVEWENEQSFLDADGYTRHGVSVFRILML